MVNSTGTTGPPVQRPTTRRRRPRPTARSSIAPRAKRVVSRAKRCGYWASQPALLPGRVKIFRRSSPAKLGSAFPRTSSHDPRGSCRPPTVSSSSHHIHRQHHRLDSSLDGFVSPQLAWFIRFAFRNSTSCSNTSFTFQLPTIVPTTPKQQERFAAAFTAPRLPKASARRSSAASALPACR